MSLGLLGPYWSDDPRQRLQDEARRLREQMSRQLGEKEARKMWADIGKRGPGRIRGERIYDMAKPLMLFETHWPRAEAEGYKREQLIRMIAEFAHTKSRGSYGHSLEAVIQNIKRALRAQDEARREAERNTILARLLMERLVPDTNPQGFTSAGHEPGSN